MMTVHFPKLAVLILQYNSADFTMQLLKSIESFESINLDRYRFILMDNCSQDPRKEEIISRFPWVRFVEYGENLGFGRAHNKIMSAVNEEWVLLLNNDCILLNDAITRTLHLAQAVEADFATCAVFNKDMSDQVNFSTLPTPLRKIFLNMTGMTRMLWFLRRKLRAARVGYINGAFLLIRRSAIPQGKLFDDRYFMYTEDLDLMYRLARHGAKGYRLAAGRVIHLGGGSAVRKWTDTEIGGAKEMQARECMQRHFPAWQFSLVTALYKVFCRPAS